jgi:hypothetical protein
LALFKGVRPRRRARVGDLVGKIYDRVAWQGSRAESDIHAKCIGWRNAGNAKPLSFHEGSR